MKIKRTRIFLFFLFFIFIFFFSFSSDFGSQIVSKVKMT